MVCWSSVLLILTGNCLGTLSPREPAGILTSRQPLPFSDLNRVQHSTDVIEENAGLRRWPLSETGLHGQALSSWDSDHHSVQQEQAHEMVHVVVEQPGQIDRRGPLTESAPEGLFTPPTEDRVASFEYLEDTPIEKENEEDGCYVCLEEWQQCSARNRKQCTACQKILHGCCIDEWLTEHNTCPNCRAIIKGTPMSSRPTSTVAWHLSSKLFALDDHISTTKPMPP
ncbi:hypothetical protein KEM48_001515 [Puccinia striiformis f. sp. tritici PST-130]|nr:hypothetical protein H4Q26_001407 [Puccinia striiformis f. sp. tritici PST-130]KAI9607566.1 hypothetical protein KEM48_001515 [Puccinia striiformis f. sp. tritici PST-130]